MVILRNFKIKIHVFLYITLIFSNCQKQDVLKPVLVSEIRGAVPGLLIKNIKVDRDEYINSFTDSRMLNKIRLVKLLTRSANAQLLPEHRVFAISKNSPLDILGFKEADILVSANDYTIHSEERFRAYLELLKYEKNAQIEIRRNEQNILIKYEFVD